MRAPISTGFFLPQLDPQGHSLKILQSTPKVEKLESQSQIESQNLSLTAGSRRVWNYGCRNANFQLEVWDFGRFPRPRASFGMTLAREDKRLGLESRLQTPRGKDGSRNSRGRTGRFAGKTSTKHLATAWVNYQPSTAGIGEQALLGAAGCAATPGVRSHSHPPTLSIFSPLNAAHHPEKWQSQLQPAGSQPTTPLPPLLTTMRKILNSILAK